MINIIESILWSIAIIMLLAGGVYFTLSLNFIQFKFKKMLESFKHSNNDKITPFKSLTIALAARVGVGSLAGIAIAIYSGGPGTIFWIWLSSIITSANTFVETFLGIKYKIKDGANCCGGPSYYIDKGLKNKKLAKFYALLIILAYIIGFMTIQSNTISNSLNDYLGINKMVIGLLLTIITFFCIMKGLNSIATISSILIPIMGIAYIILAIIIIIINFYKIPDLFITIINGAFNFKAFKFGLFSTFLIGIQRGVFSTESGLGSGAIASSTTDDNDPFKIGLIQVLGIYFTTFIVCTATALIILSSDYTNIKFTNINGIELTQYALNYHLGNFGIIVLIFSILSFAFSTIISGYYYGENSLKFLKKNTTTKDIFTLKLLTLILLFIGSFISSSFLWQIVDIFVSLMAIINMYAIIKLRDKVKVDLNNSKK